ncbi:MAG: STAS domain-containing protein [Chloroflexota bacterium]
MEFTHRAVDGVDILELSGRFDAYEVPAIAQWFDEHPQTTRVVVNLGGVGFIDSSGLATLVKGLKQCRQNGGELHLCNLQQAVLIIFELTRLDKAFSIYDDEPAALAAMKPAG